MRACFKEKAAELRENMVSLISFGTTAAIVENTSNSSKNIGPSAPITSSSTLLTMMENQTKT